MNTAISIFIGEPQAIDPCHSSEHDGALILKFLCDPLVDFTPGEGIPKPAAAESWFLEKNCRRIHFYLRKNVLFHHGREVTANDYVYSLNRVVSLDQNSILAHHLNIIKGYKEVRAGAKKRLSGVYANGSYELIVELTEPFAEVPLLFGHRVTAPVPWEVVEYDPNKFREQPVSNGPFCMSEPWIHNNSIKLTKFNKYYEKNQAFIDGGKGYVDELEFRIYAKVENAFQDWLEGKLDITKVPPAQIPIAEKYGESFRKTPCGLMQYIGFPIEQEPFNDPRVRLAIALGIDRQKIIDTAFLGLRPLATGIIPPAIKLAYLSNDSLIPATDIKRAQDLLKQAKIVGSLIVPFYFNSGLGHEKWVNILKEQLFTNLNINLELHPLEWNEFLNKLQTKIDGIFRLTWAIDYPSPDNILFPLFHSDAIGLSNFTHYSSYQFDQLIKMARSTNDDVDRGKYYRMAEKLVCEALPILPLWFGMQHHMMRLSHLEINGDSMIDIFGEPVLRHIKLKI